MRCKEFKDFILTSCDVDLLVSDVNTSVFLIDLKINQEYRRVYIRDKEINITGREYEVLEFLASHPGRIYSRDMLLDAIWGEKFVGDARTVDVHIRRLREKIEENASDPQYVKTKWGSGYYFQMG